MKEPVETMFVERTIPVKLPMRVLALTESDALHEALRALVADADRSGLRGDCELVVRLHRRGPEGTER